MRRESSTSKIAQTNLKNDQINGVIPPDPQETLIQCLMRPILDPLASLNKEEENQTNKEKKKNNVFCLTVL